MKEQKNRKKTYMVVEELLSPLVFLSCKPTSDSSLNLFVTLKKLIHNLTHFSWGVVNLG